MSTGELVLTKSQKLKKTTRLSMVYYVAHINHVFETLVFLHEIEPQYLWSTTPNANIGMRANDTCVFKIKGQGYNTATIEVKEV